MPGRHRFGSKQVATKGLRQSASCVIPAIAPRLSCASLRDEIPSSLLPDATDVRNGHEAGRPSTRAYAGSAWGVG